ncbi:MAG: DUF2442 domain-containing protein [Phycisphaerales bacterium]
MDPIRVTAVRVLGRYRLWVSLSDGRTGEVDVSSLAGRGVFSRWDRAGVFESATVDPEWGAVVWPASRDGEQVLDLCADTLASGLVSQRADAA